VNAIEQQQMKDKCAYEEGVKFLLQFPGMTQEILESFFIPDSQPHTLPLNSIYENMLLSATNVGRNINTVRKHIGHPWFDDAAHKIWDDTKAKLFHFDPKIIEETFGEDWEKWGNVWTAIATNTSQPPRTVERFCKTIISAAHFINQFTSADDFYNWIEFFDHDSRARAALPMLIEAEVYGYGFALSCDFIKGLGYPNFPKPDLHLIDICRGLGLCSSQATPYEVYKTTIRAAQNANVTPYAYDRVFYVIGSENFFQESNTIKRPPNMTNTKTAFIERTLPILADIK